MTTCHVRRIGKIIIFVQNQTKFIKIGDRLDLLIAQIVTEKDKEAWLN